MYIYIHVYVYIYIYIYHTCFIYVSIIHLSPQAVSGVNGVVLWGSEHLKWLLEHYSILCIDDI